MLDSASDSGKWDIGIICEPLGVIRGFGRVSSTAGKKCMREFSVLF